MTGGDKKQSYYVTDQSQKENIAPLVLSLSFHIIVIRTTIFLQAESNDDYITFGVSELGVQSRMLMLRQTIIG